MSTPDDEDTSNPLHAWLEETPGTVIVVARHYADGYRVERHSHSRAQLLHALSGVVMIATSQGRWIVPRGHAMWIPARNAHAVEMIGDVQMHSVYVSTDGGAGLPEGLRVFGLTDLMRSLIQEAVSLDPVEHPTGRTGLIFSLIVSEIGNLREEPLALPFPADPRLSALCRSFVAAPDAHATIDAWAAKAGMSRRSFTRRFAAQTGLAFSTWRRQAVVFAALPRLTAGESVTSVALDLGYDSVPAFTTMFRRFLGAAPRAWLAGSTAPG